MLPPLTPTLSPQAGRGGRAALAMAIVLSVCSWADLHLRRAQSPEPLAVEVTNASEPVLCAEKDNVTINLASKDVRRLRIEAAHPAYIGTIQRDSFEADWTGCTAPNDPKAGAPQPPKRTTLYEQIDFWVSGLTFQSFWRPATATVRIGDRTWKGIHLLQVWMIRPMGGEEVAVLYPQDGYWRLRPLAPGWPRAHRVRLIVPDRAGGGGAAANREDQGGRLRAEDENLHPRLRARRLGHGEDGARSIRTGTFST